MTKNDEDDEQRAHTETRNLANHNNNNNSISAQTNSEPVASAGQADSLRGRKEIMMAKGELAADERRPQKTDERDCPMTTHEDPERPAEREAGQQEARVSHEHSSDTQPDESNPSANSNQDQDDNPQRQKQPFAAQRQAKHSQQQHHHHQHRHQNHHRKHNYFQSSAGQFLSAANAAAPPAAGSYEQPLTADYLAQLIKDKKQLAALQQQPGSANQVPSFLHLPRLVDDEIQRVRQALFQLNDVVPTLNEPLELPEPLGEYVQLQEKLYVPIGEHPEYNFVGRLLGPRGMTAKQLEQETGCKIMIRGRGSMRDKKKEEQNRGKANWEHLNDELHVLITVEDTQNRAQVKLNRAIEEVKQLLVPVVDGEDELKKRQLMELAIINGTYRDCNYNEALCKMLNDTVYRQSADSALPNGQPISGSASAGQTRHLSAASSIYHPQQQQQQYQSYATGGAMNGSSMSSGVHSNGSNTPNSIHAGGPAQAAGKQQQMQLTAVTSHSHPMSPHHMGLHGHPHHAQHVPVLVPPNHHAHHHHPQPSAAVAAAAVAALMAGQPAPDSGALLYAQQYHDFQQHYAAMAAAAAAAAASQQQQQQQQPPAPPPPPPPPLPPAILAIADYHQAAQHHAAIAQAVAAATAASQQLQQLHPHHHHQQQQHQQQQQFQQQQDDQQAAYQQQQQQVAGEQPDATGTTTADNGNDQLNESALDVAQPVD